MSMYTRGLMNLRQWSGRADWLGMMDGAETTTPSPLLSQSTPFVTVAGGERMFGEEEEEELLGQEEERDAGGAREDVGGRRQGWLGSTWAWLRVLWREERGGRGWQLAEALVGVVVGSVVLGSLGLIPVRWVKAQHYDSWPLFGSGLDILTPIDDVPLLFSLSRYSQLFFTPNNSRTRNFVHRSVRLTCLPATYSEESKCYICGCRMQRRFEWKELRVWPLVAHLHLNETFGHERFLSRPHVNTLCHMLTAKSSHL